MSDRYPQLVTCSQSALVQRWLLLCKFNKRVEATLELAHTGWTAQPHTLGARLCALRGLVFWELELRLWNVPPRVRERGPRSSRVVKRATGRG